jgi:hypothetical protein
MRVILNAKDAKGIAKERKEGFPLRTLRKTLRPLRLNSTIRCHYVGFDTGSTAPGFGNRSFETNNDIDSVILRVRFCFHFNPGAGTAVRSLHQTIHELSQAGLPEIINV